MIRNKKIITAIVAAIAITGNGAIPYACFASTLDSKATVLENKIKETDVDTNLNKENVEEVYGSVAKYKSKKHKKRKNKYKNEKNTIKLLEENVFMLPEKNENNTTESVISKEIEVHKENKKQEVPNIFDLNEFHELNREQKEDNKHTVKATKVKDNNVETENKENNKAINKKESQKDRIKVVHKVDEDTITPWDEDVMDRNETHIVKLKPYVPKAGEFDPYENQWQPTSSDLDGFEIPERIIPIIPLDFEENNFLPYDEMNYNTGHEMPFNNTYNNPWEPTPFDLDGFEIPEKIIPINPIGFEENGFLPYDEMNYNTGHEMPFNNAYNNPWEPTPFDLDGFEIPERIIPINPIGFEENSFLPYDDINYNTGFETLVNDVDDYIYNVNNVLNNILNDILNNISSVNNTNNNIKPVEKVEDNKDIAILNTNVINVNDEVNNKVMGNKEKAINVLNKDVKLDKKVLVNDKNNFVKINNKKSVKKQSDNKEIKLPKTGTNSLKMLLAGIILCAIGVVTRVFSKKKSCK